MALLDPYEDDDASNNLVTTIIFLLVGLAIFLTIVIPNLPAGLPWYLVICGLVVYVAILSKTDNLVSAQLGDSTTKMYLVLIAGMALAFFLSFGSRFSVQSIYLPTSFLNPLFSNIIAPVLEALFWRGVVFPTFVKYMVRFFENQPIELLQSEVLGKATALLSSALLFGFFHVAVFNTGDVLTTFELVEKSALFGIIMTIGVYLTGTVAFELGYHFVNNLFAVGIINNVCTSCLPIDTIIIAIIAYLGVFAILQQFASTTAGD